MSISTQLEDLPDEIFILIFKYCGNTLNIFQAFLGLNHRLSTILVDQRLHLLTDYISLTFATNVDYASDCCQQVIRQLLRIKTNVNHEQLRELLQPLITYSFQEKYRKIKEDFELAREKFLSIRQQSSPVQLSQIDDELRSYFHQLHREVITIEAVQQIKDLVFSRGARLECDNSEQSGYNLSDAGSDWILYFIDRTQIQSNESRAMATEIIETVLVSNPDLLDNRGYVGNGGIRIDGFFLYTFFKLQCYYRVQKDPILINFDCFRTITNLLLLILYCRSINREKKGSLQRELIYIFSTTLISNPDHLCLRITQVEYFKLLFEDCQMDIFEENDRDYHFPKAIKNLIKQKRLDILKVLCRMPEMLNTLKFTREYLNMFTISKSNRQIFSMLINDSELKSLFPQKEMLFILLDKKERQLLEPLLQVFPNLINQLDDQGNDPLMYITLNVSGCRHRIIEMLMKKGCHNTQRQNFNGQTFRDILHLRKNEKLLASLIKYEIIVQYSGDLPHILRSYLGLNQRFNRIVLDRQSHLLTDYLSLKSLDVYYNSDEFQQATNQLLSIKTSTDEKKLGEILQPLICYGFRQRYIEVTKHFQLLHEKFVSIRQTYSENELQQAENEISKKIEEIVDNSLTIDAFKQIKELVFTRGALIHCNFS